MVTRALGHAAGSPAGSGPDGVAAIMAEWARERPDLDVSPQGLIGRLHRLAARLDEELLRVYRHHGLAAGEFDVLATLRRAGEPFERTPSDLAAATMITSGAVTKRVDRLIAAGLVTRRMSRTDGRGRVVALTVAGRHLIDAAFTEHMANEHRLVGLLSVDQRAELAELLLVWTRRLGEWPSPEPRSVADGVPGNVRG
ncbi:MAG: winged helix-turn-helix transcriptional regulator [Kineosporiaceae bacterium]|nr:winged helix-turn-helix transcriptional regulator [Kineosporiaceae bacterium]